MADECADVTNEEQLVICFRWVDENLEVHEDFVGLHPLNDTKADTVVKVILDTIQRMGLKIENARGQCYDGASTMAGVKNGVSAKIKLLKDAALYAHCYGHALNLAVNDCIRNTKDLNDVWVMLKEICNHRGNVKSERYRRKQNIKTKGSLSFARLARQFTVRHAPQYLAITKK